MGDGSAAGNRSGAKHRGLFHPPPAPPANPLLTPPQSSLCLFSLSGQASGLSLLSPTEDELIRSWVALVHLTMEEIGLLPSQGTAQGGGGGGGGAASPERDSGSSRCAYMHGSEGSVGGQGGGGGEGLICCCLSGWVDGWRTGRLLVPLTVVM